MKKIKKLSSEINSEEKIFEMWSKRKAPYGGVTGDSFIFLSKLIRAGKNKHVFLIKKTHWQLFKPALKWKIHFTLAFFKY